jgi:hypothetical protein
VRRIRYAGETSGALASFLARVPAVAFECRGSLAAVREEGARFADDFFREGVAADLALFSGRRRLTISQIRKTYVRSGATRLFLVPLYL